MFTNYKEDVKTKDAVGVVMLRRKSDGELEPVDFSTIGGTPTQQYSEGTDPPIASGVAAFFRASDGTLKAIQGDEDDRIKISGIVKLAPNTSLPLPDGAATETSLLNILERLPSELVGERIPVDGSGVTQPTKGLTESISQQFMTADDRIVTINYLDTTKTTQTSVTITSASVTTLTSKTQLTITFTYPTTTSDLITYAVS